MFTGHNTFDELPQRVDNGDESYSLAEAIQEYVLKDQQGNTYTKFGRSDWNNCVWVKQHTNGTYEVLCSPSLDQRVDFTLLEFCEQITDMEGKKRPPMNPEYWWDDMECLQYLNPQDINRLRDFYNDLRKS